MIEQHAAVEHLSALAHHARLSVFRLLVRAGREGLLAGEIAKRLDLGSTALSFHLNRLRQAGLVQQRREGRRLIYGADFGAMHDLVGFLHAECCAESPAGCGEECGAYGALPSRG